MPTQRRLINKKAYDELRILEARCERETLTLESGLKIINGKEMFYIDVVTMNENGLKVIYKELLGRNYAEIEKNLTSYLLNL